MKTGSKQAILGGIQKPLAHVFRLSKQELKPVKNQKMIPEGAKEAPLYRHRNEA